VLTESALDPKTIEAYSTDVQALSRRLAKRRIRISEAGTQVLALDLLQADVDGLKPATIARRIASFRRFYGFLATTGVRPDNPMAEIRPPKIEKHRKSAHWPAVEPEDTSPSASTEDTDSETKP
jgi:integrase/recombinase XerD